MTHHIQIRPAPGSFVIRAGGAVIGETTRALELTEGSYPPVIYIPRDDVAMPLLDRSTRQSACPSKGQASYFSVVTPAERLEDAVWSYETPIEGMEAIAGHLAFYPDLVKVEPR